MASDLDCPPFYFMTPASKIPDNPPSKPLTYYLVGGACPLCGYDRMLVLVDYQLKKWILEVCIACGFASALFATTLTIQCRLEAKGLGQNERGVRRKTVKG